jgi:hypothetical protein
MHVLVKPALRIVLSLALLLAVVGSAISQRWYVVAEISPAIILLTSDGWVVTIQSGGNVNFMVGQADQRLNNPAFFQARNESGPAFTVQGFSIGGLAVNIVRGLTVNVMSHAIIGVRHWTSITIASVTLTAFIAVDRRRRYRSASCSETSAGNDD